ncbi:hypothetical protein UY3_15607 [Chelonia mydas]|uniref:Myb/SANT-like DNA-binding domain-containing protein n=1 Tax=Chelonia mydas TaxID=8469 RepID=M7ARN7_CHEMY|nr:hypothetical protein UY3_15607 [Chelonia mydas]
MHPFNSNGQISHGLLEKGYKQDTQQCHAKMKELRQVYKMAKKANCRFCAALETCYFYKRQDAILHSDPTSTPKSLVDTSVWLEAVGSGLNPDNKVLDDVELENNVEHTAG